MELLIFIAFFGFIIFNAMKGKGNTTSVKPNPFSGSGSHGASSYDGLPRAAAKVNTARRAAQTGTTTAAKYKRIREQRRKAQDKANSGLWQSKDRQDKNRSRRSDWGARGDSALLSPQMIAVIGGAILTIYLALTVLN